MATFRSIRGPQQRCSVHSRQSWLYMQQTCTRHRPQRRQPAQAGRPQQQPTAQEVMQGACYGDIIEALAQRALIAVQQLPQHQQHLVGIAGSPGSGKSTLAQSVAQRINTLCQQQGISRGAAVAPMDGFHLYKAQLDAMPDPQEAYARRGAPWTFDAQAFVDAIRCIKQQGRAMLPSFDHGVGDPVEQDILIDAAQHGVVLVEGNYLLLDDEPWCELQQLLDECWFVDIDLDTAMQRVFERQTAIGVTPEQSRVRIATNDRPNGELVRATRHNAQVVVPSDVPFRQ